MATFGKRFPSFPSTAAHGAALAARAHDAEPDPANGAHAEGIVERVNAYGFEGQSVTTSVRWWLPFSHPSSVTPLSTGVTISWPL